MNTLQLKNGDLVLTGGRFSTVTGKAKVEQDLAVDLLFPYGWTRFHPKFGSVMESYIGAEVTPTTASILRAEVVRVINNYQSVVISKINTALVAGKKSPYGQTTLIKTVKSVTVSQSFDSFSINITIETVSGTTVCSDNDSANASMIERIGEPMVVSNAGSVTARAWIICWEMALVEGILV